VIVIVIIVLVLLVAAAIGAGVFIKNRLRKTTSDAITASQAKSENNSGAIVD
jgi:Na+-transporting methylmalonyl-CoA/oxaloacetate decarboxylase gamma subunit